jgi:hypothetical protein
VEVNTKKVAALRASGILPAVAISRFGLADFEPMGVWLVERLRERIPDLSDKMLAGWLRGAIVSNEQLLLRSENAVGMAQIAHQPLLPQPIVEEVFVFVRNEAVEEGMAMYGEFRRWASGLGASSMTVDRWTDVPRDLIKQMLGKVTLREVVSVRIVR